MAHQREPESVVLNLIPIMNLFTALIPFLLLSAAFFHLAVIQVSVPVASTEARDLPSTPDSVTLQLHITPRTFEMAPANDSIPDLGRHRRTVPRDAAELTQAAHALKRSFTASDTVIVTAEPEVPFEEVVAAMDAVRSTTVERGRATSRIALFPKVVLSSRQH